MIRQGLRGFLSAELKQLIHADSFVVNLELSLVQFRGSQDLIGQLSQTCCFLINERHKLSLRNFKPIDLKQPRACALNRCQWRLERVRQSVEDRGPQLLAPLRGFGMTLRNKGMCSFQGNRGKRSNCVNGARIELAFRTSVCDVKRTDGSGP